MELRHPADLLLARTRTPRVLVLGGSILGSGMETLIGTSVELVETDLTIGPRTQQVIDGHSIPFADGTFDGVTVQVVHEHVILRFTHLGHRRLFRRFTELDSGPVAGPGTVMAWSWEYFLASFVTNLRFRPLMRAFARITAAPLKYFDFLMIDNPGGLDAASGMYFLGRRSETAITDRELVRSYRGCNPVSRKRERSA